MTSKPILKSLHVGVGNRGKWPLHAATPESGFQPVALCDPNPEALAQAREICGLGEEVCFSDLGKALESTKADCAIICVPTHLHVRFVKQCVNSCLAVLVEKGMAPSWEEACGLTGFVLKHGAKVAVAQNYRYRPAEQALNNMLHDPEAAHAIGQPFLGIYQELRVRPEPKNLSYPFASIWDMSCHHFDTLLCWFGPVESVTAQAWGAPWSAYEHPNNTSAHLVFQNGVRVHYIHGHDAACFSNQVEIHGEKGAAVWADGAITFKERGLKNFERRPGTAIPVGNSSGGEAGVLEDFHRYVVEGVEPGISVRNNLEVMAVCEMMVQSIRQNKTIRRSDLAFAEAAPATP